MIQRSSESSRKISLRSILAGLSTRARFSLGIGAVLPILLLGFFAFSVASEAVRRLVHANNASAARIVAEFVSRELQTVIDLNQTLASLPSVVDFVESRDESGMRTRLRIVKESFAQIDRLFVTDRDGTLWSDYPQAPESLGLNFSEREWYRGVSQNWQPYVSGVYRRHAEPKPLVVAIAVPIHARSGEVIGTLVSQYRLDATSQWLLGTTIGENGYVFVVDHNGVVAANPKFNSPDILVTAYGNEPGVRRALAGDSASTEFVDPVTGIPVTATAVSVPIGQRRWAVVSQQPTSEAFRPIRTIGFNVAVAASVLGVLAAGVTLGLARASEQNRRLGEQLEASNRELEAFSYSVSHDLRSPLRHLDGFVALLRKHLGDNVDDTSRRYLATIGGAARQMDRLIYDLLQFSRMAKVELRATAVPTQEVVAEVIEVAKSEIKDRKVDWKISFLPNVFGDAAMLRQVWSNLVMNALKYSRPRDPAKIEIGAYEQEKETVFFVKDNGVGFDPQYTPKLFGIFQRLHRSDEFEGTGVGLAIVRRIILRHGGRTWAEGRVDEGATFYFSIPMSPTKNKERG